MTVPPLKVHEYNGGGTGQWGYYDDGAMGSSSGLLLLGVRYYSPAHGRFWSWDSVPNENLYAYVENSATIAIDPSGLSRGADFWKCYNYNIRRGVPGRQACQFCKQQTGSNVNCGASRFDVPGIPKRVVQWVSDFHVNCGPGRFSCYDCCVWLMLTWPGEASFVIGYVGFRNFVPSANPASCVDACLDACDEAQGDKWEGGKAALRAFLNCLAGEAKLAVGGEVVKSLFPIERRVGLG